MKKNHYKVSICINAWNAYRMPIAYTCSNLLPRVFVPLDQRSENKSSESNHFEITKEITEFCPSGFTQSASMAHAWNGCSQSSRFLRQARRIVGSGDENDSQPIRFARFDGKFVNCGLPISDQTRALDPCHRPEGSWALGTRMCFVKIGLRHRSSSEHRVPNLV